MTKLIIQIPCFNEEESLPHTLAELPRNLIGIDRIEWLVIDDGSSDRTADVAREHGVDHVVSLPCNQGLAAGFKAGLEACVRAGAAIIVNTDADNQYHAGDIGKLIQPILEGRAEMVIGSRPIQQTAHFSKSKILLQRLGSAFIRLVSKTDIPDAPSGFRAFSRDAAKRLNVFTEYTYTLETIIQAGLKNMAITWVPVRTNGPTRPSRLISSIPRYIRASLATVARIFVTYRPLMFFTIVGGITFLAGFLIGARFLYFYLNGDGEGHVQSLIFAGLLMGVGFQIGISGILADLISVNRKLIEKVDWNVQNLRSEEQQRTPQQQQSHPPRGNAAPRLRSQGVSL